MTASWQVFDLQSQVSPKLMMLKHFSLKLSGEERGIKRFFMSFMHLQVLETTTKDSNKQK